MFLRRKIASSEDARMVAPLITNENPGALFIDGDGNRSHPAVQIASPSKDLKTMSYKDFFVT